MKPAKPRPGRPSFCRGGIEVPCDHVTVCSFDLQGRPADIMVGIEAPCPGQSSCKKAPGDTPSLVHLSGSAKESKNASDAVSKKVPLGRLRMEVLGTRGLAPCSLPQNPRCPSQLATGTANY